ncbi:MAG: Fur family transcriptional regulator [Phycisphaerales bacterium]
MDATRALFARHGLRCTVQREAIYRALAATKSHPTAEELFSTVRERCGGLSLATVYNTLDALARRGLCRRIADPSGGTSARFDADTSAHVHFVADDGAIRDVPPDLGDTLVGGLPPSVIELLEQRMGIRVDQVRIELIGRSVDGGRC